MDTRRQDFVRSPAALNNNSIQKARRSNVPEVNAEESIDGKDSVGENRDQVEHYSSVQHHCYINRIEFLDFNRRGENSHSFV